MKKGFILILASILFILPLTSCNFMVKLFGKTSEYYLYKNRQVIAQHNAEWIGAKAGDNSRSVTSDLVEDTYNQLDENMDYLAQNDWITSVEFYTKSVPEEVREQYKGILPDNYIDYPLVIMKTNNGVLLLIDISRRYTEEYVFNRSDLDGVDISLVVNLDTYNAEGLTYQYASLTSGCLSDSFSYQVDLITNKFPYPMYYKFYSKKANMHTDPDKPDYQYWGVDLTGIESEIYRSYEYCTAQRYIEICDEYGYFDKTLFSDDMKALEESDYWPF